MIDVSTISYKVIAVTPDGSQIDVTGITSDLGWEEGRNELAVRISLRLYNADFGGKYISELVQPGTPIFVYADIGTASREVARGTVAGWNPTWSNSASSLVITAYDEMIALRRNQDNRYYSDGTGTKAALTSLFEEWGIPLGEYKGPDVSHAKMAYKNAYLSDIVKKILDAAEKKGAGKFIVRAAEGKIYVLPRGGNEEIYHFGEAENVITAQDRFDASNLVTRVKIVGKEDKEGHRPVEAVIDGKTEFGIRQIIHVREQDKSLADAEKAAQEILKEKGDIERKINLQAPDLPTLRKGDRIHVSAGTVRGYFFVVGIRHNADDGKMQVEIEADKEKNAEESKSTKSGSSP